MAAKIERVTDSVQLGEAPHWDAETQSLYFVDITGQSIHKYVPPTKKHSKANIGKHVSLIIPVKGKNDQFVITIGRELVLVQWDGESEKVSVLQKVYEDPKLDIQFNDGKCDPTGRLWAGTLPVNLEEAGDKKGNLLCFQGKKVVTHLTKIGLSNGLAFDTNLKKFYYIDSYKGTLDQYDYDVPSGKISNEKPIFTLNEKAGLESQRLLDGMTIDTDGNLWVAVFNDSRIIKIDPRNPGTEAASIQLPVKQITSLAFGGLNLDELYVTTGRHPIFGATQFSTEDGATLKVTGLNAKGLPGVRVVL